MRTWPTKLTVLLFAVLMGMTALLAGTFAWDTEQQALNTVLDEDATTHVTLQKLEMTSGGAATENPISNVEFRLYKADGMLIGGPFVTDSKGQIKVMLPPGDYYFEETAPAADFTYDRDPNGNLIKKYSFTINASDTSIIVKAYNRKQSGGDDSSSIVIEGEKTWDLNGYHVSLPKYITVYLMDGNTQVEEQEVYPDASGHWIYRFTAPKYRLNGTRIQYTVKEKSVTGFYAAYSGYDIKNTYIAPIEVELPEITKVVEGKGAPKETFSFRISGGSECPVPNGLTGSTWKVSRSGKGTVSLGKLIFTEPGDYVYTVYEVEGDDYNWEYDPTEYTVTIHIRRDGNNLTSDYTIRKDGVRTSKIVFTNVYEQINLNKKITISGQKTWYHMDNPEENWPDNIVVKIYADGSLVQQRKVTAETDWKYSFELPKYNSSGKEILYQVDETEIEDYSKKVQRYDLINTYVGTPDKPEPTQPVDPTPSDTPDTPNKPERPAKTGEEFDLSYWISLLLFSFCGLILMILLWVMNPPYRGKRVKKKGKRLPRKKRS